MSQQNQLNDIGKLKEILVFYLRRWKIFLVSFIVCISIAILYLYITKPVYLVTANFPLPERQQVRPFPFCICFLACHQRRIHAGSGNLQ